MDPRAGHGLRPAGRIRGRKVIPRWACYIDLIPFAVLGWLALALIRGAARRWLWRP